MSYQSLDAEYSKAFIGSYTEVFVDDDAHDESDYSDGAHRRTTTKSRKQISYTLRLKTKADKTAVSSFVADHRTVTPFYFEDHFTEETLLVRFTEMPSFSPIFGDSAWDVSIKVIEI